MGENQQLMKISYFDPKAEVLLTNYADTIVYYQEGYSRTLTAIRFGGYPEQVRGMTDAIYGGISFNVELENQSLNITTLPKQYDRKLSHDGIYAESMLIVRDDAQMSDNTDENQSSVKRKMFIFCEAGNTDHLFAEVDKKTAVPLIPEFKEYFLSELIKRKILIPLKVLSAHNNFDAWMLLTTQDEGDIIGVVNDGLANKEIIIPQSKTELGNSFDDVTTVSEYLKEFGVIVANRIKGSFKPLFDPANEEICDRLREINGYIHQHAGYPLYPAQLAVAESVKRRLDSSKVAMIIAECGSGKTKIGSTALHSYQQKKSINVVLCPSHLTKKWVREIEESLPNTFAAVVHSITEFNKLYDAFSKDNKTAYCVISKEKARDGYMRKPAVTFNRYKKAFVCPNCGKTIMMELNDDGTKYKVKADQFFFIRENEKNHKCEYCGNLLWTCINPSLRSAQDTKWLKIGGYGFVYRPFACQHLYRTKDKKAIEEIQNIVDEPDGIFITAGAYRRYPISTYIKKKVKQIDGIILDELHLYKGDSGQGAAMAELVGVSKKVVGMTATLVNGYSSGIFYLLYRLVPQLMTKDGKEYKNPKPFNDEYGVTECVYELKDADYNANRRNQKTKKREKQLPGVSPLVYSRFLMESSAFLSLDDMGKQLPEYEEIPIALEMNDDVASEYRRIENKLREILQKDKAAAKKILAQYLGILSIYPDQPYGHNPIWHPIDNEIIVEPEDTSNFDELHEKDIAILDIVEKKIKNRERVMIFTNWVKIDTQDKLYKLLNEKGYKTEILSVTVPPDKREDWVEKRVDKGVQVLITNPSLVETGLDLNAFTTLIFYNIGYNLFTFRQASRRSWRINQKAPRVEVYMFYYTGTMQHRAMKLMASKLSVATIIEGNLSDEGLASLSECSDMTTLLAKELTLGIKNEVDDIADTFKKMAILKTDAPKNFDETIAIEVEETSVVKVIDTTTKLQQAIEYAIIKNSKPRKRKGYEPDENQLSLFEMLSA